MTEMEELTALERIRDEILEHIRMRSIEGAATLRRRLKDIGAMEIKIQIEVVQLETTFVLAQQEVYQGYLSDHN
jgi:hypothetical protein